ncbi:putative MscS mechanosensitive ion channel (fragment) [Nostocoides australiense Ben110]|uniref:Putative MscS mechanosensitive ion channel n=1 Tax=Nostocoides australiense Ben110 TaxID=1193182 RepID=W6JZL2_9MICO
MVEKMPAKPRRGRPRLHAIPAHGSVRVELRLAPEVARRLFAAAADSGQTVSAVGESALIAALLEERAM